MRFIRNLFILIVLIFGAGYFAANYLLDKGSQEMLAISKQQAGAFGIKIDTLKYDSVRISSPWSVTWYDTEARVRWSDKRYLENEAEFDLVASKLTISLVDLSSRLVQFSARDFHVAPTSRAVQELIAEDSRIARSFSTGSVEGRYFEVATVIDPKNPRRSVKSLASKLVEIPKKGSTVANVDFRGRVKARIRGADVEADVSSIKKARETYFVLDRQDVARISELYDEKLTEAEIDIIANSPARAPLLFTIKDYAETKASEAFARDKSVPEDPYRHVLWSYLLTREFGPEYAKTVTDAHEQGPTGNTAQERKQDYNNNAVGRRYALNNVQENEILQRVRTDPGVMRDWNRS